MHAYQAVADGLPALGIVAAVLGVIHAMGALDQSPEVLGGLIGAALVGTFGGIFLSYGVVAPIATKIKVVRHKQLRLYTLVKQSLLAFMNGAMPQVAVEFGRKTIPAKERPTIDTVENETSLGGGARQGSGLTHARSRTKSATPAAAWLRDAQGPKPRAVHREDAAAQRLARAVLPRVSANALARHLRRRRHRREREASRPRRPSRLLGAYQAIRPRCCAARRWTRAR